MQFGSATLFAALLQVAVLSACGSEGMSASEINALSPTSKMPSGTATYEGEVEQKYTQLDEAGYTTNETFTADLHLDANFDAGTVDVTTDNFASSYHAKNRLTIEGSTSGYGYIYGSDFYAETSGSYILANRDQSVTENVNIDLEGRFRGDEADAMNGTASVNGLTGGTFIATKQ